MRCQMSEKKTKKIRDMTGLPIKHILVRGNTNHCRDLIFEDKTCLCLSNNEWQILIKTGKIPDSAWEE